MLKALALLALLAPSSRADTVFLKNGRQMEGVVTEESPAQVTVDIGYGTVVLRRADIRRIRRSGPGEKESLQRRQRREAFETGRWVPAAARGLFERFREVRRLRTAAGEAKLRREALKRERAELDAEVERVKRERVGLGERLKAAQGDRDAQYALTVRMNVLGAELESGSLKLDEGGKEAKQAEEDIRRYMNEYRRFKDEADGALPGLCGKPAGGQERDFCDGMGAALQDMERDFMEERAASVRRGAHVIVDALLNGKVKARLLVDTGASQTGISRGIAQKLGLDPGKVLGPTRIILADGRAVATELVLLDSVAIGNARAERTAVVILPTQDLGDSDGLLGMSFLKHFLFQIDSEKNVLILRQLK